MGAMADLADTSATTTWPATTCFAHFRPRFRGTLIGNVGMTQTRGNQLLADGTVDLVAFGQAFIANPDLPQRFAATRAADRPGPRHATTHPEPTATPTIRCRSPFRTPTARAGAG